jgi:hypothetical protein
MQVGDIVKSLDFVGIDDCYMIGKVVGISKMEGTFRAEFIKRVWCGENDRREKAVDFFTAPLQGNHFMDRDESPRVFVIG